MASNGLWHGNDELGRVVGMMTIRQDSNDNTKLISHASNGDSRLSFSWLAWQHGSPATCLKSAAISPSPSYAIVSRPEPRRGFLQNLGPLSSDCRGLLPRLPMSNRLRCAGVRAPSRARQNSRRLRRDRSLIFTVGDTYPAASQTGV